MMLHLTVFVPPEFEHAILDPSPNLTAEVVTLLASGDAMIVGVTLLGKTPPDPDPATWEGEEP